MHGSDSRRGDLPKWLWLFAPFVILVVQVAARSGSDETYWKWMRSEVSVPELGTVFWLVLAIVAVLALLVRNTRGAPTWYTAFLACFAAGAIYFCGEEASWGQHYLHWNTPEAWAAVNDQKETNLHNISALLDQFPRLMLTLAALVGGVVVPIARSKRPALFRPGTLLERLGPTYVCMPAALLALTIRLPQNLCNALELELPHVLDMQPGEFVEYFLGMFLAMYALSMWHRRSAATVS